MTGSVEAVKFFKIFKSTIQTPLVLTKSVYFHEDTRIGHFSIDTHQSDQEIFAKDCDGTQNDSSLEERIFFQLEQVGGGWDGECGESELEVGLQWDGPCTKHFCPLEAPQPPQHPRYRRHAANGVDQGTDTSERFSEDSLVHDQMFLSDYGSTDEEWHPSVGSNYATNLNGDEDGQGESGTMNRESGSSESLSARGPIAHDFR
jgi:hypothetical protein